MPIDPLAFTRSYDAGLEAVLRPAREIEEERDLRSRRALLDRQAALQEQRLAGEREKLVAEQAAQQRRMTIGGLAAAGDWAGARRAALEAGEFEFAKTVGGLQEDDLKRLDLITRSTTPKILTLQDYPLDLRRGRLETMRPELLARGLTDEQIDRIDLSDQGLKQLERNALTIQEAWERTKADRDYGLRVAEFDWRRQDDMMGRALEQARLGATLAGLGAGGGGGGGMGRAPSGYRWRPDGTLEAIPGGPGDVSRSTRKAETDLRKEFQSLPEVKDFNDVAASYRQIRAAAAQNTAASDLQLIFSYMKMLDPQSVVREGEFATAQNAAGVADRVRNLYNRVLRGTRLTPQQRNEFVLSAASVVNARVPRYNRLAEQYRSFAADYGGNPDRVARVLPVPSPRQGAQGGGSGRVIRYDASGNRVR